MKLFVFLVVCGVVCAEPPRFRSSRLRGFARQEVSPSPPSAPEADAGAAPYPPSGWKPDGDTLELPTEQTEPPVTPVSEYGPPPSEYGPPANEYGPPDNQYGPPADAAAPEDLPADEPDAESVIPLGQDGQSGRLRSSYILLVDPSTLQRVRIAPQRAPAKLRRSRF